MGSGLDFIQILVIASNLLAVEPFSLNREQVHGTDQYI